MKVGETVCWACSATVPEKTPKSNMHTRFHTVINVLFIMFCVLTPLALVLPSGYTPTLKVCVAGLIVLGLVRSSMQTMTDARNKS